jgi:hypothetical protein
MEVKVTVLDEVVEGVLASAFDSGIAYWARVAGQGRINEECAECWLHAVPLRGGWVDLSDGTQTRRLNRAAVQRGLEQMANHYGKHFGNVLTGGYDASTGDILVQLALFGEVRYG